MSTEDVIDLPSEDGTLSAEQQARIAERVARKAERDFWQSRPVLAHIHKASAHLLQSPWTLLGMTLLRALHTVPYYVRYSSAFSIGSFNTIVIFVADSGGGKSILDDQLDALFDFGGFAFYAIQPGSGEAIAEAFASFDKKTGALEWYGAEHAQMFSFDEVGNIAVMKKGNNSSVLEYFKTGWSGGSLGRRLVGGEGVQLPKHSYRLTAFINTQPERSGVLLSSDETAGGFPGRGLWLNIQDPTVVKRHDALHARHERRNEERVANGEKPKRLARPERMKLDLPKWPVRGRGNATGGYHEVHALPQMDEAHTDDKRRYHEGKRDVLHGHELMVQVGVAVALMVLDSRMELNDDDWDLAEVIMNHSRTTRSMVRQKLAEAAERENVSRGRASGKQKFAEQKAFNEETDKENRNRALDQFERAVLNIQKNGLNVTPSRVKKPMTESLVERYFDELWAEWQTRQ